MASGELIEASSFVESVSSLNDECTTAKCTAQDDATQDEESAQQDVNGSDQPEWEPIQRRITVGVIGWVLCKIVVFWIYPHIACIQTTRFSHNGYR